MMFNYTTLLLFASILFIFPSQTVKAGEVSEDKAIAVSASVQSLPSAFDILRETEQDRCRECDRGSGRISYKEEIQLQKERGSGRFDPDEVQKKELHH